MIELGGRDKWRMITGLQARCTRCPLALRCVALSEWWPLAQPHNRFIDRKSGWQKVSPECKSAGELQSYANIFEAFFRILLWFQIILFLRWKPFYFVFFSPTMFLFSSKNCVCMLMFVDLSIICKILKLFVDLRSHCLKNKKTRHFWTRKYLPTSFFYFCFAAEKSWKNFTNLYSKREKKKNPLRLFRKNSLTRDLM